MKAGQLEAAGASNSVSLSHVLEKIPFIPGLWPGAKCKLVVRVGTKALIIEV